MKSSSWSSSSSSLPKLSTAEKIALVLLPLFLIVLICALNFPNEFHLHSLVSLGTSSFSFFPSIINNNTTSSSPSLPKFRLLMGILTLADRYEDRDRLRLLHSFQPPVTAQIDVKFVLCNLTKEEQRTLVAVEIMRYDDIIILNCTENMNSGKTYAFFSSLPKMFKNTTANTTNPPYDFVMKTDDDTYFRFPELVESLSRQPRHDLYWGHMHPAENGNPTFMRGMGYALSWDLVEWIASPENEFTRNHTVGAEDTLVGRWLEDGGRGKNLYDTRGAHYNWDETKPVQYDYPYPPWTFVPNTISVHRLKTHAKWAETLRYFNMTVAIPPSRFYHVD